MPPAGWYRDPSGVAGQERWWDGSEWTDQVRAEDPGEEPWRSQLDEEAEERSAGRGDATSAVPAGWYRAPSGAPGQERWWDGSEWSDDLRDSAGGSRYEYERRRRNRRLVMEGAVAVVMLLLGAVLWWLYLTSNNSSNAMTDPSLQGRAHGDVVNDATQGEVSVVTYVERPAPK